MMLLLLLLFVENPGETEEMVEYTPFSIMSI